jgi:glycine betaine/choline ABC-type transport system substrate-binding protein
VRLRDRIGFRGPLRDGNWSRERKSSMNFDFRLRNLFALFAALVLAVAIAACGDDDDDGGEDTGGDDSALIESNPDNEAVELTIGSKNFDEQFILGEIYAQALEAAGYKINKDLNFGSEVIAKKALEQGELDAYPEYTSTTLTSLYKMAPEEVPGNATEAYELAKSELEADGLTAYPPTPFSSANAVGLLTEKADELGVETISDLEGKSQDLVLYGTTECRQRIDCLLGLEQNYGLEFKDFKSVDPELRYEVLDNGDADLSIVFTTDGQLYVDPDTYTILEDDQELLPAGNVILTASQDAVDEAGEDFGATVEKVQENLTLEVMQELNARVSLDREDPADVAHDYLQASGYIE